MDNNNDSPWLDRPEWKNGQIHSNAASTWKVLTGFTLLWNLVAFGITAGFLLDRPPRFPAIEYLILLFPVVGLLLAWAAIKAFRQWRRYGLLNLSLDPYPGSIGGEVGGSLTLSARPAELKDLEAVLSCVHVRITRSSGKGGSSRSESVVWQQHANTRVEMAANGSRIIFLTRVDAGLPSAEPPSNNHHQWLLKLASKQAQLDRQFDLPVFDLSQARTSRLPIDPEPPAADHTQLPPEMVQVSRRDDGLELVYPPSRSGASAWILLLFGLVFGGLGVFLVTEVVSTGSMFASAILGFMALVFCAFGLGMTGFALYLKLNELRILIGTDSVTTRRRIGPWKSLKSIPVTALGNIDKHIGMQSSQGASTTVHYRLEAGGGQQKLVLGDGIKGQPAADALLELIRAELGRDRGADAGGSNSDDAAPSATRGLYDPEALGPEKVAQIQRWIKTAKWVFNIIMIVFVGLFLLDFFELWGS